MLLLLSFVVSASVDMRRNPHSQRVKKQYSCTAGFELKSDRDTCIRLGSRQETESEYLTCWLLLHSFHIHIHMPVLTYRSLYEIAGRWREMRSANFEAHGRDFLREYTVLVQLYVYTAVPARRTSHCRPSMPLALDSAPALRRSPCCLLLLRAAAAAAAHRRHTANRVAS
jgi:hypothetical protein